MQLCVSFCSPDGEVRTRERWCWTRQPAAVDVLDRVMRAQLAARRAGLTLHVDDAGLGLLLGAHGFATP